MSNKEAPSNVDVDNVEIVKMLYNVVTLFDQKATLSEQDIRAKKDILNALRRLTTIPKMNPMKINELLSMILSKMDVQNLLHLRAVCSHWKSVIEAICAQKKCLKLYSFDDPNPKVSLVNRFFGTVKLECFVELKLKYFNVSTSSSGQNELKENFCYFLEQIFPNVEQFIVDLNLDVDSVTNLLNMLENFWPNLHTLSLAQISDLYLRNFGIDKLKRLDVLGCYAPPNNPELISQLEHFSGSSLYDLEKMPQLGPNCTSFCWAFQLFSTGYVSVFDKWIQHNSAQVLGNITRLGLFCVNDSNQSLIGLICVNFPALQVLSVRFSTKAHLFNSDTCVQLAKLPHMNTLSLGFILFDLDSLENIEIITRFSSVRVLNLSDFDINETANLLSDNFSDNEGDRFCRILISIFPNIEKFGTFSSSDTVHNKIRVNLNQSIKFRKLHSINDSYYW